MNEQPGQPNLTLVQRVGGAIRWIPLTPPQRVPAAERADYTLIDQDEFEAPRSLRTARQGEDLAVSVDGTEVLVLEGFFAAEDVNFYPTTNIAAGAGPFSGSPISPSSSVRSAPAESSREVAAVETDGGSEGDGGGSPLLWGGLGLLGLGALAGAGGGGGGGGGGGNPGPTPTPTPTPAQNTVAGDVVAGPVIAGNGLSVEMFDAGGTNSLGQAKVGDDGTFSVDVGSYSGVVIVRVADADSGEDHLDEASQANQDLTAALSAVVTITDPDSTVEANVNPLTTLAAALAERAAGSGALTPAQVAESNAAIAALFGLSDLHSVTVEPINGSGFDAGDGLSAAERYGAILAAFSGADFDNGGNAQQTLDAVLDGLTLSGTGQAQLSEAAQALLIQGARTTEQQTGVSLGNFIETVLDTVDPQFTSPASADPIRENSGAGQDVYTAVATDAGIVTYSLKDEADADDFQIDAATGVVTLIENPDFETQPSYTFTVVATDTAGNSAEQTVSLSVEDRDDSEPGLPATATVEVEENIGAGQAIYTVVATDEGTVTYSLKDEDDDDDDEDDAEDFSIDPDTGVVTLLEDPDHEAKPTYTFTVVATDEEGNSAEQVVTVNVIDLDEVAPTITSGGVAPAIDENSGADQVVYTVIADDTADISDGVTFSLAPGDDAASFTIDPASGEVTLLDDPDQETQARYDFTVVATDAAGNSAEQDVRLNINDLDEVAPTITSSGTAPNLNENSPIGQVVYTVRSDDDGDISSQPIVYSLVPGADAAAFNINSSTGQVRLNAPADHETKSSYSFTVRATDGAGNSSQRAVSLTINDLDEVAPTITSGGTAPAIVENSGAGQVVYTVTSTDDGDISTGNTLYSLSSVNDGDAFSINANTGAVTLDENPDFESQSSYSFTVIATDAAGNSSQRAVTLAINDIADETGPSVDSVALTSSVGAQNNTLNAGDTVRVTVTMTENTVVNTSGGTPRIELRVGTAAVFADYVSGSGSTALIFEYVIQPGQTDNNGIRVPSNALEANGATLADSVGNPADLAHPSVASNPLFLVDTTSPTLSSSSPSDNDDDVAVGDDIVLTFSDDMQAGSGNITISNGSDTRVISASDASQVSFSGNQVTIDPTADLQPNSNYNVQIASGALTDEAGNPYAGISNSTTLDFDTEIVAATNIVVFDLVQGSSSDHSGRTFQSGVSYDIYIRVNSNSNALSTSGGGPGTWGRWDGVNNLGSDDRVILVGSGSAVIGPVGAVDDVVVTAASVAWQTASFGQTAGVLQNETFTRFRFGSDNARLFDSALPTAFLGGQGGSANTMYLVNMPAGILTSQGLV